MINFDGLTKENITKYSSNWRQIPDRSYRILIIGCFGSGKTNSLFNLISYQPYIDKICSYVKDPYESKYQFLINKQETAGLKHLNDSKAFIECSNDMDNIYQNTKEYSPNTKRKILIFFDDMIADMLINKKLNPIVTELVIRSKKLNIYLAFIIKSYFAVSKNIRLNCTHYFITKIPNKRDLQQMVFIHSSDIDFIDFMNLYKEFTEKSFSFLVNFLFFLMLLLHQVILHILERIF